MNPIITVHPLTNSPTAVWDQLSKTQKSTPLPIQNPSKPVEPGKVRIVCMSDTHSLTNCFKFDVPYGDILIHAGDFTHCGQECEVIKFNDWMSTEFEQTSSGCLFDSLFRISASQIQNRDLWKSRAELWHDFRRIPLRQEQDKRWTCQRHERSFNKLYLFGRFSCDVIWTKILRKPVVSVWICCELVVHVDAGSQNMEGGLLICHVASNVCPSGIWFLTTPTFWLHMAPLWVSATSCRRTEEQVVLNCWRPFRKEWNRSITFSGTYTKVRNVEIPHF